jgi:hypothetical protein
VGNKFGNQIATKQTDDGKQPLRQLDESTTVGRNRDEFREKLEVMAYNKDNEWFDRGQLAVLERSALGSHSPPGLDLLTQITVAEQPIPPLCHRAHYWKLALGPSMIRDGANGRWSVRLVTKTIQ